MIANVVVAVFLVALVVTIVRGQAPLDMRGPSGLRYWVGVVAEAAVVLAVVWLLVVATSMVVPSIGR